MEKKLTLWTVIRLPLLGLLLYLFRFQIVELIELTIGFWIVMNYVVYIFSTFSTRLLLCIGCILILLFCFWVTKKIKISQNMQYLLYLIIIFLLTYFIFSQVFNSSKLLIRTLLITSFIAINTIPYQWYPNWIFSNRVSNLIFLLCAGVVEVFIPQAYIIWLTNKFRSDDSVLNKIRSYSWLTGIISGAVILTFLLLSYDNQKIISINDNIYSSSAVQKFSEGDYNWIELSIEDGVLYAIGRQKNYIFVFDLSEINKLPRKSIEYIGEAQSFAFNPEAKELYVYKFATEELIYINSITLETIKSVKLIDLSPGDYWIKWHSYTDSIVISSEADIATGTPLFLVDRESGKTLATMSLPIIPTAYLDFHPEKPLMYFNSFQDTYFILWDMLSYEIKEKIETSPRTDRISFLHSKNEVWVASPLEGRILQYDADTLVYKGEINVSLGDRTFAIDTKRNLLLTGNFFNNNLQVIDLNSQKPIASFYIGPWMRTIALDIESGIAYVSTIRGLYKVNYLKNQ